VKRSALVRFVAFLGVLAVLVGYVAYHKAPGPVQGGGQPAAASSASTQSTANYIANLKQQRDQLMSKEMMTLKALVSSPKVSQAARSQAQATLVQDTQELKQAMQVEGVLAAHGFPLAVAMLNPNEAEIVIGTASLSKNQVATIADTVTQVTGLAPQNIVIVPKTAPAS
jgi:hypothetical protein